jgi:hypothetical protein
MSHPHVEILTKVRREYIMDLAMGAFDYLDDHTDQNIANKSTTNYNVLAEMVAAFLLGFPEKKDQIDILQDFINMIIDKVEYYENLIKENNEE